MIIAFCIAVLVGMYLLKVSRSNPLDFNHCRYCRKTITSKNQFMCAACDKKRKKIVKERLDRFK